MSRSSSASTDDMLPLIIIVILVLAATAIVFLFPSIIAVWFFNSFTFEGSIKYIVVTKSSERVYW